MLLLVIVVVGGPRLGGGERSIRSDRRVGIIFTETGSNAYRAIIWSLLNVGVHLAERTVGPMPSPKQNEASQGSCDAFYRAAGILYVNGF
jgi:hypothetical protein